MGAGLVKHLESKKIRLSVSFTSRNKQSSNMEEKSVLKLINVSLPIIENFLNTELKIFKKGVVELEFNLVICGQHKIRNFNKNFRKKDKITDVLSFPVHESLRTLDSWIGPLEIGDILICKEVAKRQAKKFEISYAQEVVHLFIHGLLHLCGYDHELSASEKHIMNKHEEALVKKIYKKVF